MPTRRKRKDALLKNLGFPIQVLKIFEREGYQTVEDILRLSASDFLKLPGAKERHLKRLREIFSWFGYTEKDMDLLASVESEEARKKSEGEIITIVVYERNSRPRHSHDP